MKKQNARFTRTKGAETIVSATLYPKELFAFLQVREYVKQMTGIDSNAETLRFLIRDWTPR